MSRGGGEKFHQWLEILNVVMFQVRDGQPGEQGHDGAGDGALARPDHRYRSGDTEAQIIFSV